MFVQTTLCNVLFVVALLGFTTYIYLSGRNAKPVKPDFTAWMDELRNYVYDKCNYTADQAAALIPSIWKPEYDAGLSVDGAFWHRAYLMQVKSNYRKNLNET